MTQPQLPNPWLQLAMEAQELLKQEPPEVQRAVKRMNRKTYPQTIQALLKEGVES